MGCLNRFYGIPTSPSASLMAQFSFPFSELTIIDENTTKMLFFERHFGVAFGYKILYKSYKNEALSESLFSLCQSSQQN